MKSLTHLMLLVTLWSCQSPIEFEGGKSYTVEPGDPPDTTSKIGRELNQSLGNDSLNMEPKIVDKITVGDLELKLE